MKKLGSEERGANTLLKAAFLSKIDIYHPKEENDLEPQHPMPATVVTHNQLKPPGREGRM